MQQLIKRTIKLRPLTRTIITYYIKDGEKRTPHFRDLLHFFVQSESYEFLEQKDTIANKLAVEEVLFEAPVITPELLVDALPEYLL